MSEYQRRVIASFDDQGVVVYQAFKTEIVQEAVRLGTFGRGFGLDRMTWIKPSFGWMLHRSGYASKTRQEAIARIRLSHEGFRTILENAAPTSYDRDLFDTEAVWALALRKSEVRYQWDPDRDLRGYKLERRAIQLGISGEMVHRYVRDWIIGIEDVTALAHAIRDSVAAKQSSLPEVPEERIYSISPELERQLGYDVEGASED